MKGNILISGFVRVKVLSKVAISGPEAVPPPSSDSFIIEFGQVYVTISVRFILPGILTHQRSTLHRV